MDTLLQKYTIVQKSIPPNNIDTISKNGIIQITTYNKMNAKMKIIQNAMSQ